MAHPTGPSGYPVPYHSTDPSGYNASSGLGFPFSSVFHPLTPKPEGLESLLLSQDNTSSSIPSKLEGGLKSAKVALSIDIRCVYVAAFPKISIADHILEMIEENSESQSCSSTMSLYNAVASTQLSKPSTTKIFSAGIERIPLGSNG